MSKAKKIILITLLSIFVLPILILAFYLATYEVPAQLTWEEKRAIIIKKASKYLQQRYNEEFDITTCGEYVNSDNYIAYAYVRGVPQTDDYKVIIRGWRTSGKEKIIFRDNYVAVKMKPELKEYIKKSLESECPDCIIKIDFLDRRVENNVDEYKNIDEFLTKDTYWKPYMDIEIIMYEEKIRKKSLIKKYNRILSILVDKNITGCSSILYTITNSDIYNNIINNPDTDFGTYGKDYVYADCYLEKNKNFDIDIDFGDE